MLKVMNEDWSKSSITIITKDDLININKLKPGKGYCFYRYNKKEDKWNFITVSNNSSLNCITNEQLKNWTSNKIKKVPCDIF